MTASERRTRGRGRRVLGRARVLGEGGRGWQAGCRGGAGWAVKPSRPRPQRGFLLLFFFLFLFFSFLLLLFEFKFGLNYEFKIDVTYLLEFREFYLAILYNKIGVVFVIQK